MVKPGSQRRAFTYVKDLARGIALVGEKGWGDGYALGQTETTSVLEIAEAFGGPVNLVDGYAGRQEASNDPSKARELGWEPTLNILSYIREFVAQHPRPNTQS